MKNEELANEIAACRKNYAGDLLIHVQLTDEQWATVEAALRANAAPQGGWWIPITAAPDIWKDGRELLLYDAVEKITVVGQWGKHNHVPLYGWIRHIELYGEEVDGFSPTYAMPLPAAPDHAGHSPAAGHAEPDSVVVPREPTQEMIHVGIEIYFTPNVLDQSTDGRIRRIYLGMLAAAPKGDKHD